ncbi:MAG: tRNA preQ1(34) S-adenosylmethionine ribosyltransferase-isomerase QueA [Cyanobacteria bacterium]|nr:tRNA preQ1(34) S-adenosylmethionine ribosyltransferase-isomerase QueA [Cyanobacteriota bacterium]MDA0866404.1 tRNA preQ1(34) S-adenosylmethionine ribosyltransferase-isomerase QueA [Cyanobacteriota bacterium]
MGHCSGDDLSLEAYQYLLPSGYIAQNPVEPRDHARLMAITSPTEYCHHHIFDLPTLLRPGDLLVLNDTKVIPARLYGHKLGGAKVEVLLLEARGPLQWLALVKPGRRLQPGAVIHFGADPAQPELMAQVTTTDSETGGRLLDFTVPSGEALETVIDRLGQMPLPPYITASEALPERYQTIYAKYQGAVAAPTAGLHFTQQLFEQLATAGINHAFLTLHVGVGTFRPVEADVITDHQMHGEWLDVPEATVAAIQATKANGGRVIAVGTTVIRALEGAAQDGILQPFQGKTNLFIYPGYRWQVVDGLMTNFHLPGSSLLMLVSALVGRQRLMDLYQAAIAAQYRFYSFGDAMVILPEARLELSGD